MTPRTNDIAVGEAVPAGRGLWRAELGETMKLALPIALTQLGQIAMMTTDLALVGRLGDLAVAATALAHVILFSGFVLGMGLVSAVAPLAAQAFGSRQPRMVRRSLRVGLWAALIFGAPVTAVQLHGGDLLIAVGQSPETAALAGQYLTGLAWSMIPGWWFIALRNFMGAVKRPEPALWITLAAVPANAMLAYALIFGAYGLPRLELLGAGIATTLISLAMCVAAIWVCYACRPFKKFRVLGRFWRADWPLLGKLIAVGAPISGAFALEYGLFAIAAVFMGWIGTAPLAAHQIALQIAAILFMVPFGISMAATVRVGHAVGRRDAAGTRRAGFAAIAVGAAFMAVMTLVVIATRNVLPLIFLGASAQSAADAVALASLLLVVGATFFIADGVQTVTAGALRGLSDTRIPMLLAALSFWAIGLTACYSLAFTIGLGALGIWIGFTLGVGAFAVLLLWRFEALTRRGYMPQVATPDDAAPASGVRLAVASYG